LFYSLVRQVEIQRNSNNLKRRNEKPDLTAAEWRSVGSR